MTNAIKNPAIAQTILDQFGGLGRLQIMIGAHYFSDLGNGVSFAFKGVRKANRISVTLDADDTYTVEIGKLSRSYKYTVSLKVSDIYAEQLKTIFEEHTGLLLSLAA